MSNIFLVTFTDDEFPIASVTIDDGAEEVPVVVNLDDATLRIGLAIAAQGASAGSAAAAAASAATALAAQLAAEEAAAVAVAAQGDAEAAAAAALAAQVAAEAAQAAAVAAAIDAIAAALSAAASASAASGSAAAALASQNAAAASAAAASASAAAAAASQAAAAASAAAALASENAAAASAGAANTSAGNAATSETNAAASAGTATTQAGIATTGANTATTQAGIATTQAGIATTQAGLSNTARIASEAAQAAAEAAAASITFPIPIESGGTNAITAAAGLANLGGIGAALLTTRGDIITRGVAAPQRLALGAVGNVLLSDGTDAIYGTLTAGSFASGPGIVTPAMLDNGLARSVLGVTGNAAAARADIQGATDQVFRINGAGTAAAWGAIDISKAAAVTGVLQAASEPAHTGDVTNSAGSLALTIAANAVTNAKAAQMAASTYKGNDTGSTANAKDLTAAELRAGIGIPATELAKTATYTVDVTDRGKYITFNSASGVSANLPAVATAGNGFTVTIRNLGVGLVTIDPSGAETIEGASNVPLDIGEWATLTCNGTTWFASSVRMAGTAGALGILTNSDGAIALRPDLATQDTAPNAAADSVYTWDDSAGSIKRVLLKDIRVTESLVIAASDETTAITTGVAKVTFRMPCAAKILAVRASLSTASSSGIPTFDINEAGTTILSTKLTIDASELTSVTAATAAVISDPDIADDALMTIDFDVAGTGAKGVKIEIFFYRV